MQIEDWLGSFAIEALHGAASVLWCPRLARETLFTCPAWGDLNRRTGSNDRHSHFASDDKYPKCLCLCLSKGIADCNYMSGGILLKSYSWNPMLHVLRAVGLLRLRTALCLWMQQRIAELSRCTCTESAIENACKTHCGGRRTDCNVWRKCSGVSVGAFCCTVPFQLTPVHFQLLRQRRSNQPSLPAGPF